MYQDKEGPQYLLIIANLRNAVDTVNSIGAINSYTKSRDVFMEEFVDYKDGYVNRIINELCRDSSSPLLARSILYIYLFDQFGGVFLIQNKYNEDREKYIKNFNRLFMLPKVLSIVAGIFGIAVIIYFALRGDIDGLTFSIFCILCALVGIDVIFGINIVLKGIFKKPKYYDYVESVLLETNFLASIIKTNMDGMLMVAKNPKYSNVIKDVYNDIRKSIDEVSRV